MFAKVYVLVMPRCSNGAPVRASRGVHAAPSSDPDSVHCCGSRSGTSFALVRLYDAVAWGVASSACQMTCDGGPMMHHLVVVLPSYVCATVSPELES